MDAHTRAKVRSCRDVYRVSDTARHFGITRVTVRKIWAEPDTIEVEPPNIWDTKPTADLILADTQILLDRGYTLAEVATELRCSVDMIRSSHDQAGIRLQLPEVTGSDDQRRVREDRPPGSKTGGEGAHTPGGQASNQTGRGSSQQPGQGATPAHRATSDQEAAA